MTHINVSLWGIFFRIAYTSELVSAQLLSVKEQGGVLEGLRRVGWTPVCVYYMSDV